MDLLVNLAVLLVVGYFILGLFGKIKKRLNDVLPLYTTERSKAEIEKESQEIIKRELNDEYGDDFEEMKSMGYTGFLHYYLRFTSNDETLTTTAKSEIVKTLSENDLLRDLKLLLFIFVV